MPVRSPRRRGALPAMCRRAAAPLVAFAAAACASDEEPPAKCPAVETVPDAGRKVAFSGQEQRPAAKRFVTRIAGTGLQCVRADADGEPVLRAKMKVNFLTERGPALRQPEVSFRYFVAVVDGSGDVLAREAFPVTLSFKETTGSVRTTETISPSVPLPEGTRGDAYTVYVGLELSQEQLRYNRENNGRSGGGA